MKEHSRKEKQPGRPASDKKKLKEEEMEKLKTDRPVPVYSVPGQGITTRNMK